MSKTYSLKWNTYHIEFIMAPNPDPKAYPEPVGTGWAVEQICYRGADFGPIYNFRDTDGVVKVRARSESFPSWKAKDRYIRTKRDLEKWTAMYGWIVVSYMLVREEEDYTAYSIRKGLELPRCCRTYPEEALTEQEKQLEDLRACLKFRPWGYSWADLKDSETFCKETETTENELKEATWPAKEMITGFYKTYPKFT